MSTININGPYMVRQPHHIIKPGNTNSSKMWPVVHANNTGVDNAIAWAATEMSAQAIADGLNIMCAIRNQKG